MKVYVVAVIYHFDVTRTTDEVRTFVDKDKAEEEFQNQVDLYHGYGWLNNTERDILTPEDENGLVKQRGFIAGEGDDVGTFHKGDKGEVVMYVTNIIQ